MTQQPLMLEKKYADLEYIKFYPFFDECFTQFKSNEIFLFKISSHNQAIFWVKHPQCQGK
jgi:hypothetical protein